MATVNRARMLALPVALLWLAPSPARANGRFPSAEQVVVQPGAPNHVVVRTTFGILTSKDGGHTFDWICEDAANYGNGLDPGIGVTGDGTIFAGVFGGVSSGHGDACTFDLALPGTFISDVTIDKSAPSTAYAVGSKTSGGYFLWRSKNDATTWAERSTLPNGFIPATVDVAPSDPSRIYASGGFFADGGSTPSLARSIDGGASWQVVLLPTSAGLATPYIAGVDPIDPLTVWVRPDVEPGVLFVTHDAGDSWTTALTLAHGSLLAFAISPDGATVLAGGPMDGVYAAASGDAGTPSFQAISNIPATCLAWPDGRVFACTDDSQVGYALAESDDGGAHFSPLLRIACVRGPLDCPAGSGVAQKCTSEWPMVGMQIHHDTCSDAGSPTSSSSAASSGAGGAAASSSGAMGGSTGTGSVRGGGSGCGCKVSADDSPRGLALELLGVAAILFRRNRRRRRA